MKRFLAAVGILLIIIGISNTLGTLQRRGM